MRVIPADILLTAALLLGAPSFAQQPPSCPAPPALSVPSAHNIFTPQQEIELGEIEAEALEKDFRVIHDDEIAARLNSVASRLLAQLPPTQLKFRVAVIDAPTLDSFSIGASRIYVSRKLIAFLRNEDELAGLLAHEMGHILTHQHGVDTTYLFHEILGVDSVGDRKDILDKYNRMLDTIARDKKVLNRVADWRRREEQPEQYEADRVALYAVAAAGFSPRAFVDFFDRLAQTHGKTGNWLTDAFGTTRPDQKRLREIHRFLAQLPPACSQIAASAPSDEFLEWQSEVIAYSGLNRQEHLVGVVAKQTLEPALRTDIINMKFSPDGVHALAQDESSIFVFTTSPLAFSFRIDADGARPAQFSPDSQKIVILTRGLRVEEWSVEDQDRTTVHEVTVPEGCIQSALSHDGRRLACVNGALDFSLIDVENSGVLLNKKAYFAPNTSGMDPFALFLFLLETIVNHDWIHAAFSQDDHYLVVTGGSRGIAVDVRNHSQISVHGALSSALTSSFAFLAPDRIIAASVRDPRDSGVFEFPSGKALQRIGVGSNDRLEPTTRSPHVIVERIKDSKRSVGVVDIAAKRFLIESDKATAIDVFDQHVLFQKISGEAAMYDLSTLKQTEKVELPKSTLGELHAWAASPDLAYIAFSSQSRGGVWDLRSSKRLYHTRGFHGAYFDGNAAVYADFPQFDKTDRAIVRADLSRQDATATTPIDKNAHATQQGQLLLLRKPAGKDGSLNWNTVLEVEDVRDGHLLWTHAFPREVPDIVVRADAVIFRWSDESSYAKQQINSDPALRSRMREIHDRQGVHLLELVDKMTGNSKGRLLMSTGNQSFKIERVSASGDWVFIGDDKNRVHIYGRTSGEQKATLFGSDWIVSPEANALLVENEAGHLDVYDLKSFQKMNQLDFEYPISGWSFSSDGSHLLVLTSNQVVYTFDCATLGKPESPTAIAQK